MRQWTLATAGVALLAAALWHLPATAQRSPAVDHPEPTFAQAPVAAPGAATTPTAPRASRPQAAAGEPITFEQYRDFRLRDIARRQARIERELADPDLSSAERSNLEARRAYYDRLTTMPAVQRDRLFRARFDQIDTDHDGTIDAAERAAWRAKQSRYYRDQRALAHAAEDPDQR